MRFIQETIADGVCVGMLVTDAHADTTALVNPHSSLYASDNLRVAKANVLAQLSHPLYAPLLPDIRMVGIAGLTDFAYQHLTGLNPTTNQPAEIYGASDISELARRQTSYFGIPMTHMTPKRFQDAANQIMLAMQNAGVTHIWPSIDVDVLNPVDPKYGPLTGFDYSWFAAHVLLGVVHVPKMISNPELAEYVFFQQWERLFSHEVFQLAHSSDVNLDHPYLPVFGSPPPPISVDELLGFLTIARDTAGRNGIKWGLPTTSGNTLAGEIVELSGIDFEGNTARAAGEIAQTLGKLAY